MSEAPERTALYRVRGEEDALLYIGISNCVPIRWNGHERVQPWWDELRSLTVEWYDSRPEAEEAEKAAILAEQPRYNVTYLKPGRGLARRRIGAPAAVDWESAPFEPRDDDDELLDLDGVGRIIHIRSRSSVKAALRNYGGPRGFTLGTQHFLYRKGQIRRWIDAVEAFQQDIAQPDDSADDATEDVA